MFLNWRESADSRIISAVAFEGLDPPPDWVMDFRLGDSLLMAEIENALISFLRQKLKQEHSLFQSKKRPAEAKQPEAMPTRNIKAIDWGS
jgi:hypothetical protein